jgi:hypothetical protein
MRRISPRLVPAASGLAIGRYPTYGSWQNAAIRVGRAPAIVLALLLCLSTNPAAAAEDAGDLLAFLLGLRDQKVFAGTEVEIPLNGAWGVARVTRLGPGRYTAQHKGGVLRLEATASSPGACVYRVTFVMRTAGALENTETWTLDLSKADVAVERRSSGQLKGIGARVKGPSAFCYTSTLRPDACTDNQLFDDHTPGTADADLDRKTAELEDVLAMIRATGCAGP